MDIRAFRLLGIVVAGIILLGITIYAFASFVSDDEVEAYEASPPVALVGRTSYSIVDADTLAATPLPDATFRALHDQANADGEWIVAMDMNKANAVGGRVPAVLETLEAQLGGIEGGEVREVELNTVSDNSAEVLMTVLWNTPESTTSTTIVPLTLTYGRDDDTFTLESVSSTLVAQDETDEEVTE